MEAAFVNIDLKLPRGASLGLYARRNALPTHTNYDIMEVVKGNEEKTRTSRAIKVSMPYLTKVPLKTFTFQKVFHTSCEVVM